VEGLWDCGRDCFSRSIVQRPLILLAAIGTVQAIPSLACLACGTLASSLVAHHDGRLCSGGDAGQGAGERGGYAAAHEEEDRVKSLRPRCVPAETRGFQQVFYFVGVPLVQFLNHLLGVKAFLRRDAQRTLGAG
jgi:hypothetical protein